MSRLESPELNDESKSVAAFFEELLNEEPDLARQEILREVKKTLISEYENTESIVLNPFQQKRVIFSLQKCFDATEIHRTTEIKCLVAYIRTCKAGLINNAVRPLQHSTDRILR